MEPHTDHIPSSGQDVPSNPSGYISLDHFKEIRTCFRELLKKDLEVSVAKSISEVVQHEHQSLMQEKRELREFTTFEVNSLKEEFKSDVDNKLAEIAQLQVYLISVTENLQKVDEHMDKLFKNFSSMIGTIKTELTNQIWNISIQSTSSDQSELTKHISTCFGSITSHLSTLFDEAKKGKVDRNQLRLTSPLMKIFWQQSMPLVRDWTSWISSEKKSQKGLSIVGRGMQKVQDHQFRRWFKLLLQLRQSEEPLALKLNNQPMPNWQES